MHARTFGAGILVGAVLFTGLSIAIAWTGPMSAPPNGNVAAPINTGTANQVKDAGLSVDALAVFGNSILSGTSRYLNFGTTVGTSGYGIRDNAGTMEFKNSGGAWAALGGASGGQWSTIGTNISNTNTGNVGIDTATPAYKLDVNGSLRVNSTADVWQENSASSRTVRIGYESTGTEYARLIKYGSTHASMPGRLLIDNMTEGSNAEGGYIDFRPNADYMLLYPAGAASGYLRLYAGGAERLRVAANGDVISYGRLCLGTDCISSWPTQSGSSISFEYKSSVSANYGTASITCSSGKRIMSVYVGQNYNGTQDPWQASYCNKHGAAGCTFRASCINDTSCSYTHTISGHVSNSTMYAVCGG